MICALCLANGVAELCPGCLLSPHAQTLQTHTCAAPLNVSELEQIFCMVGHRGPEDPSHSTQSPTDVACPKKHNAVAMDCSFQRVAREHQRGQVWTEPETCSNGPHRRAAVALIGGGAGTKAQHTTVVLASALRTIGDEGPQQQSRQELMIAIMAASNHKPLISNQVFTRRVIKGLVPRLHLLACNISAFSVTHLTVSFNFRSQPPPLIRPDYSCGLFGKNIYVRLV